jgi:hypothetical protein
MGGQRYAPDALYPRGMDPGTHCTGGWVGPRAGLDTEVRGKILSPLPGIEPRSPSLQSGTILTELAQLLFKQRQESMTTSVALTGNIIVKSTATVILSILISFPVLHRLLVLSLFAIVTGLLRRQALNSASSLISLPFPTSFRVFLFFFLPATRSLLA